MRIFRNLKGRNKDIIGMDMAEEKALLFKADKNADKIAKRQKIKINKGKTKKIKAIRYRPKKLNIDTLLPSSEQQGISIS